MRFIIQVLLFLEFPELPWQKHITVIVSFLPYLIYLLYSYECWRPIMSHLTPWLKCVMAFNAIVGLAHEAFRKDISPNRAMPLILHPPCSCFVHQWVDFLHPCCCSQWQGEHPSIFPAGESKRRWNEWLKRSKGVVMWKKDWIQKKRFQW